MADGHRGRLQPSGDGLLSGCWSSQFDANSAGYEASHLEKGRRRWPVCGIPDLLYTDRGRDFKSTHIEQVCADLKIKVVRTRRRKPRGRGKIERFFKTVDQRFTHKRKNEKTEPVSLSVLEAEFHEWLMTEYHQKKHKGMKTAPMVKWNEGKCLARLPESLDVLDLMLHKVGCF